MGNDWLHFARANGRKISLCTFSAEKNLEDSKLERASSPGSRIMDSIGIDRRCVWTEGFNIPTILVLACLCCGITSVESFGGILILEQPNYLSTNYKPPVTSNTKIDHSNQLEHQTTNARLFLSTALDKRKNFESSLYTDNVGYISKPEAPQMLNLTSSSFVLDYFDPDLNYWVYPNKQGYNQIPKRLFQNKANPTKYLSTSKEFFGRQMRKNMPKFKRSEFSGEKIQSKEKWVDIHPTFERYTNSQHTLNFLKQMRAMTKTPKVSRSPVDSFDISVTTVNSTEDGNSNGDEQTPALATTLQSEIPESVNGTFEAKDSSFSTNITEYKKTTIPTRRPAHGILGLIHGLKRYTSVPNSNSSVLVNVRAAETQTSKSKQSVEHIMKRSKSKSDYVTVRVGSSANQSIGLNASLASDTKEPLSIPVEISDRSSLNTNHSRNVSKPITTDIPYETSSVEYTTSNKFETTTKHKIAIPQTSKADRNETANSTENLDMAYMHNTTTDGASTLYDAQSTAENANLFHDAYGTKSSSNTESATTGTTSRNFIIKITTVHITENETDPERDRFEDSDSTLTTELPITTDHTTEKKVIYTLTPLRNHTWPTVTVSVSNNNMSATKPIELITEGTTSTDPQNDPEKVSLVKKEPIVYAGTAGLTVCLVFLSLALFILLVGIFGVYKMTRKKDHEIANVSPYSSRRFSDI